MKHGGIRRSGARAAAPAMWLAGCLAGWLAMAGAAHAGRPFTTDDAGVLDARACEWESAATRLRSGGERSTGVQTQLGCGVGHGAQASLSYGHAHGGGEHAETAGLGGKFALVGGGDAGTSITATVTVNALRAVGSTFRLKDHAAALVLSHGVAEGWTLHANLGHLRDRSARESSTAWNLALERALGAGLDAGAEVYGDDRAQRWLAAGLRWTPSESVSLNASLGRSLVHGQATTRLASIGAKLSF